MNSDGHHACERPVAYVNGRSLRAHLQGTSIKFGRSFKLTDAVPVCVVCHRFALQAGRKALPFKAADGVMRVCADYSSAGVLKNTTQWRINKFEFTEAAFRAALRIFRSDPKTATTVTLGTDFTAHPSSDQALAFSEAVCQWGRGERVWGNLKRHHPGQELGERLESWLRNANALCAHRTVDVAKAIEGGIAIKGLHVAFASKHLRMLNPARFAVLDAVLEEGLGIAMNPTGYDLFLDLLNEFKTSNRLTHPIGDIEGAIFVLIRQTVRAKGARGSLAAGS